MISVNHNNKTVEIQFATREEMMEQLTPMVKPSGEIATGENATEYELRDGIDAHVFVDSPQPNCLTMVFRSEPRAREMFEDMQRFLLSGQL